MEKKKARQAAKKSRVERSADEDYDYQLVEVEDDDDDEMEMEKEMETMEVDRMGKVKNKKEKKEKGLKKKGGKNKKKKGGKKNKDMSEERKKKRAERKKARLEKKKAGKGRKTDEEEDDDEQTRQKRSRKHKNKKKDNKKSGKGKKGGKALNKGNKGGNKGSNKKSREQRKEEETKSMGSLAGIATLRRSGDVVVGDEESHKIVTSTFTVGPLQLEVSKTYGEGKARTVRTAKASTDVMSGTMVLKVKPDGSAHVKKVVFKKPEQVDVLGSISDQKKRSDTYLKNSVNKMRPIAAQKIFKTARYVLKAPSTVERKN